VTDWRRAIAERAAAEGFPVVGFTAARLPEPAGDRLERWLAAGMHAGMGWLAETAERRRSPERMWSGARSAIVLGASTAPSRDPLADLVRRDRATLAVYARRRDYHEVVKKRLKRVARWLHATSGAEVKVFVDTAPLLEKPLAAQTAIGWQGKHTCLVSRTHGSWLLLGEILTTLELAADAPHADRCGSCRRCLTVCPTDAFPEPYVLDARRCLAYWSIEHDGPIPLPFREPMGNRVFGCDDCLAVCPWNRFAAASRDAALAERADLDGPALAELAGLDDAAFRRRFSRTPIKRSGRDRLVRNALIAIGNSGSPGLAAAAERLVDDASAQVRGAALWALRRLDPERARAVWARRAAGEPDPTVRLEAP
jgi:epoxyqueuosine reductase